MKSKLFKAAYFLALLFCVGLSSCARAATVTGLQAEHRSGQTFLTFGEVAGEDVTYRVFRDSKPIQSVAGLTPIASLKQGSGVYPYREKEKPVHNLVISDNGAPLPDGTGVLVWTTEKSGSYFYAVTNSLDETVLVGQNTLASPVVEKAEAVPGAIQIDKNRWMQWEDFRTWNPQNGYYGIEFGLFDKGGDEKEVPLVVWLHGANSGGYFEAGKWAPGGKAVWITPSDLKFNAKDPDPTTGTERSFTYWAGGPNGGVVQPYSEARIIRFCKFVMSLPKYRIDANRVYIQGGSMGGGGALHTAWHNPGFFAAVYSELPWINAEAWFTPADMEKTFGNRFNSLPVGAPDGPRFWNWIDMNWVLRRTSARPGLPPTVFFYRRDDGVLPQGETSSLLRAMEARGLGYAALWRNGGHKGPGQVEGDDVLKVNGEAVHKYHWRFKLNEAYPAFAGASDADPFEAIEGGRNARLDWSSSLRDLFPDTQSDAIEDTPQRFAITLRAGEHDASARVTIRNAQQFLPAPGRNVRWTSTDLSGKALETGTAVADVDGLVTVPIKILAAGNRLMLDMAPGTAMVVALSDELDGQTFISGTTVPLKARAAGANGKLAHVEWLANGVKIGQSSQNPFEFQWKPMAGHFQVTAKAIDAKNQAVTSRPLQIRVARAEFAWEADFEGDLPGEAPLGWHSTGPNKENGNLIVREGQKEAQQIMRVWNTKPGRQAGASVAFSSVSGPFTLAMKFKGTVLELQMTRRAEDKKVVGLWWENGKHRWAGLTPDAWAELKINGDGQKYDVLVNGVPVVSGKNYDNVGPFDTLKLLLPYGAIGEFSVDDIRLSKAP